MKIEPCESAKAEKPSQGCGMTGTELSFLVMGLDPMTSQKFGLTMCGSVLQYGHNSV